jgi:acyl-coenzyme A synthetase/AMP-(fatty) acid ligase
MATAVPVACRRLNALRDDTRQGVEILCRLPRFFKTTSVYLAMVKLGAVGIWTWFTNL